MKPLDWDTLDDAIEKVLKVIISDGVDPSSIDLDDVDQSSIQFKVKLISGDEYNIKASTTDGGLELVVSVTRADGSYKLLLAETMPYK